MCCTPEDVFYCVIENILYIIDVYTGQATRICEIPGDDISGIAFGRWKDQV
jgi:hypothetical protein